MKLDHLLRAEALARRAAALGEPQRAAFLDQECGGDAQLRAEVDFFVQRIAESSGAAADATAAAPPRGERAPVQRGAPWSDPRSARAAGPVAGEGSGTPAPLMESDGAPGAIGPYKLLEPIGHGGFGTVYLAEQQEPVRRRVALKLLKLGMDTRAIVARFRAERQALAMMDHPCVAKVYDAGSTSRGRPFFVMEHVAGVPITDYCDRHRLDTRARLALFRQVCDAVQHAHQKGIIHRDLKPANVLVTMQDGRAVPKVIDFGVAKALHQPLTDATIHTEQGQLIGTPEYMSPEQAEMTGLDVDTRTDVYSLGVMLYQLLSGTLPFESSELRRGGVQSIQKFLREQEPLRPSTRVSRLGQASVTAAASRSTDVPALVRQISGDLDWITLKAMEKDRTRRYASASELGEDVRRSLDGEPVEAHPPGAAYLARKFVGRNRPLVLGAAATLVAIVLGLVGTSVGLSQARSALRRALEAETLAVHRADEAESARQQTELEKQRAEQQRARAQAETDKARAVKEFLTGDLLYSLEPGRGGSHEITMREALDRAAASAETKFPGKPAIEASIQSAIGSMYDSLGRYAQAEKHLRRAVRLARDAGDDARIDLIVALTNLAVALMHQGQPKEAEALCLEALANWKEAPAEGGERVFEAALLENLANAQFEAGRTSDALKSSQRAIALRRKLLGPHEPSLADSLMGRSKLLRQADDLPGAEQAAREAVSIYEALNMLETLGGALAMQHLAEICMARGRYDDAEPLCRKGLAVLDRVYSTPQVSVANAKSLLARLLHATGRTAEAEPHARRAAEMRAAVLGSEHPDYALGLANHAALLASSGRADEAEPNARRAVEIARRAVGIRPDRLGVILETLSDVLDVRGQTAEAIALLREAIDVRRSQNEKEVFELSIPLGNLGRLLVRSGRASEAEPVLRDCVRIREATSPFHWALPAARGRLGDALARLERFNEAEPLLSDAYQRLRRHPAVGMDWKIDVVESLVRTYDALNKPKAAQRYRRERDRLASASSRSATNDPAATQPE